MAHNKMFLPLTDIKKLVWEKNKVLLISPGGPNEVEKEAATHYLNCLEKMGLTLWCCETTKSEVLIYYDKAVKKQTVFIDTRGARRERLRKRILPVKNVDDFTKDLWFIIQGAVTRTFNAHPEYLPKDCKVEEYAIRNSITKRIVGEVRRYITDLAASPPSEGP